MLFRSAILAPPFWIFELRVQIRNERPQKSRSTNLNLNQVKLFIFVRHIGAAILNFKILTSKSDSASPNGIIWRTIASMPTKGLRGYGWSEFSKNRFFYIFSKYNITKIFCENFKMIQWMVLIKDFFNNYRAVKLKTATYFASFWVKKTNFFVSLFQLEPGPSYCAHRTIIYFCNDPVHQLSSHHFCKKK